MVSHLLPVLVYYHPASATPLEDLDAKIHEASEAQKASQTLAKELHEKKKEMKAWTGIKQQHSNKGSRGKMAIPEEDNLEGDENTNLLPSASTNSQSHTSDL